MSLWHLWLRINSWKHSTSLYVGLYILMSLKRHDLWWLWCSCVVLVSNPSWSLRNWHQPQSPIMIGHIFRSGQPYRPVTRINVKLRCNSPTASQISHFHHASVPSTRNVFHPIVKSPSYLPTSQIMKRSFSTSRNMKLTPEEIEHYTRNPVNDKTNTDELFRGEIDRVSFGRWSRRDGQCG